jgi:hypothetical protein
MGEEMQVCFFGIFFFFLLSCVVIVVFNLVLVKFVLTAGCNVVSLIGE